MLSACSGSGGTFVGPPTTAPIKLTHAALVIGGASGTVYSRILTQYNIAQGTGSEDPTGYDMVVFDCNTTSPQALANSGAIRRFLNAGKAVVLLNNTAAHREAALKGVLFAHEKGDSAGSIFYITRDRNGTPNRVVQIDFPVHILDGVGGKPSTLTAASPEQLSGDADAWMASFQKRFPAAESGNISPPPAKTAQTVLTYDYVVPASINMPSILNSLTPGYGLEFCGNITQTGGPGSCNGQNPSITDSLISANFETMFSVLLEPNGSSYSYKIISRQFALLNTAPFPGNANWSYGFVMGDALNGVNRGDIWLVTMMGFNEQTTLSSGPEWGGMTVVEAQPTATNNTSSLATSQDQSESVGLSATGGYQGGGVGLFGVNWSDTWGWDKTNTINISDWSTQENPVNGTQLAYSFWASGNTPDTLSNIQNGGINGTPNGNNGSFGTGYLPPNFTGLKQQATSSLNALQVSGLTTQDESAWQSQSWNVGSTPAISGEQTFDASASFQSGEVYQMYTGVLGGGQYTYGNIGTATLANKFVIDFDAPGIAPPNPAPWTLSFGQYVQKKQSTTAQVTGTVTLNQPASAATTIFLTYAVQPQVAMIVQPAANSCPGNTTQFIPSNSIEGSPPLSVTIPAGQKSQSFTLTLEVFNSDTYNLQVVAWLPSTTLGGTTVNNPQSAWCLTPPNVIP